MSNESRVVSHQIIDGRWEAGHGYTQYTVLDDTVVKEHKAAVAAAVGDYMQKWF